MLRPPASSSSRRMAVGLASGCGRRQADMSKKGHTPVRLPLAIDLETKPVLKKLATARSASAELKSATGIVPNEAILINTLSLQEAKDGSAIENIVTAQDDLFRGDALSEAFASLAAKEVHDDAMALREGSEDVRRAGSSRTTTSCGSNRRSERTVPASVAFREQNSRTMRPDERSSYRRRRTKRSST
jgi:hypothetical protein